ncbi:hypothetical protein CKJ90_32185, partial [Klebsiella pneumoniae]
INQRRGRNTGWGRFPRSRCLHPACCWPGRISLIIGLLTMVMHQPAPGPEHWLGTISSVAMSTPRLLLAGAHLA